MKHRLHAKYLYLLGAMFVLMFAFTVSAEADVKQTAMQASGIPITWTAPTTSSTVLSYTISSGKNSSSLVKVADVPATTTSYVVPAQPGSVVYIKVAYSYKSYSGVIQTSGYVGTVYGKTAPPTVTGVNQIKWWRFALSSDVGWNQVESADGYQLIFRNSKGKIIKQETTKFNSNRGYLNNVKNNMVYTLEVRAFTKFNGMTYYGGWSPRAYLFTSAEVKSSKISGGKLKVTWAPVNGATGYDIYVSKSPKKGYKKVKTVKGGKKSSATISKFKKKKFKGKKYYVYVVTRKKVAGRTYTSGSEYYWKVGNKTIQWL